MDYLDLLQCPRCEGDLARVEPQLHCQSCGHAYEIDDGLPLLFCPNEWEGKEDVTDTVKEFYEETPFPNYEAFDSVDSLARKAREGIFARMLDEQVPPRARVIECGTGTGQLTNFLSIANRELYGTDICVNSLRLGQDFARRNGLQRAHFVQQNLFRPAFKPQTFDLVISTGVLHHTSDPFLGFQSISRLVRPGGFLLVGLYHRYGRLITDARRVFFRLSGDRLKSLDPNLRDAETRVDRERAWFADQYKHPHESKHTIAGTIAWYEAIGFEFVRSVPHTRLFQPVSADENLFEPQEPGRGLERFLAELGMIRQGSREGGFFICIGRRPVNPG